MDYVNQAGNKSDLSLGFAAAAGTKLNLGQLGAGEIRSMSSDPPPASRNVTQCELCKRDHKKDQQIISQLELALLCA